MQFVLGDSRVLGTGRHIWLCGNLGASSPGPNQQSTWAALRLCLQRQEDSVTCSGALLTGDVQEPDRDRNREYLLLFEVTAVTFC